MSEANTRAPLLSRLTTASATLLAGVYAAGFLVITFRLGQYGVLDLNPLRPQIFLAGALFIGLTAIPVVLVLKIIGLIPMQRPESPHMKPVQRRGLYRFLVCIGFYVGALSLAYVTGPALFRDDSAFPQTKWFLFLWALLILSVLTSILARYHFDRFWHLFIVVELLCQGLIFWILLFHGVRSYFWLTNWYYAAGIATFWAYSMRQDLKSGSEVPWEFLPLYFVGLVTLYSTKVYPSVFPQIGGGAPSQIVLYLSDTAPLSTCTKVFLLDETEKGYYVLLKPDDKSGYFIRREAVRAIKFGVPKQQTAAPDDSCPALESRPYPVE